MTSQATLDPRSHTATEAPRRFTIDRLPTPIGTALIVVDDGGCLRAFDWEDHESRTHRLLRTHYGSNAVAAPGAAPEQLIDRLAAYFDGDCTQLDGIDCATGGTAFQRSVWAALRRIPVGATMSYGALATAIGSPKASRAVGLANGANPIGLVVPCHRVIGADGSLTGYGGGMERKRWLLDHERNLAAHH